MKSKLYLKIYIVLVLAVLTACTPNEGVFEVDVQPVSEVQLAQANETDPGEAANVVPLESAKEIAFTMLKGSVTDLMGYIELANLLCTNSDGLGGPPKCAEGEPEGTEVSVFPSGGSEGTFVREDELNDFLAYNLTLKRLYAVYRVTPSSNLEPDRPAGEYALLFEREQNDYPTPITALIQDGKLVGLNFSVGVSPEEILKEIPVADILVPPQEVESWLGLPERIIETRPTDEAVAQESEPFAATNPEPLTSSITPGVNPGWLKYTLAALHTSFEIPESWMIDETQIGNGILYLSPPDAEPNIIYFSLAVDNRDMEEVEYIYRSSLHELLPYTISGKNGFQVVHEDSPRIQFLIPSQEIVIVLLSDTPELPEIQQILSTFNVE